MASTKGFQQGGGFANLTGQSLGPCLVFDVEWVAVKGPALAMQRHVIGSDSDQYRGEPSRPGPARSIGRLDMGKLRAFRMEQRTSNHAGD